MAKIRTFTIVLGIILLIIVCCILLVSYLVGKEAELARQGRFRQQISIVLFTLNKWASDNDGLYPANLTVQSKKDGKPFAAYFEKQIAQPYTGGYTKLDSMITFMVRETPAKLEHGQRKPGSIEVYVFGDGKGCVVVGYGYKKQPIIRTDSDEFKKFYDAYLKMIKPNR